MVVGYTLSGLIDPSDVYRLFVKGQPLVNQGSTQLTVQSTNGSIRPGAGFDVQPVGNGSVASVKLRDDTDTLVALEVER